MPSTRPHESLRVSRGEFRDGVVPRRVDDGGADEDAPRTLVGVSDKMKGKGKQPFTCLEKDQSFHLFQLP